VVWDLKENKAWCQLRDPHRASVSDVVWNPEDGLYMVTACDDDSRPVLKVWDLRSSTTTPLCELVGHTKGVVSVDWCPHDPNLLVSCGKDGHTFVWDIQQGRPIAEVPNAATAAANAAGARVPGAGGGAGLGLGAPMAGGADGGGGMFGAPSGAASVFGAPAGATVGAGYDGATSLFGGTLGGIGAGAARRTCVRWSRRHPALLAACSLDRRITVHNIAAVGPAHLATSAAPSMGAAPPAEAAMRHAPKWLRRPVGAAFGFGGRLVTFAAPAAVAKGDLRSGSVAYNKVVHVAAVNTDYEFATRALQFEGTLAALEGAAPEEVAGWCDAKAREAAGLGDAAGAGEWGFVQALLAPQPRDAFQRLLGFDRDAIAAELARYTEAAAAGAGASAEGGSAGESAAQETPAPTPAPEVVEPAPAAAAGGSGADGLLGGMRTGLGGWGGAPAGGAWGGGSAEDFFGSAGGAFGIAPPDAAPAPAPPAPAAAAASLPAPDPAERACSSSTGSVAPPAAAAAAAAAAPAPATAAPAGSDPTATYAMRRVPTAAEDKVVARALLVGNFHAAVAACLAQERLDDALLLASASGSGELWESVRAEYFKRKTAPLYATVKAVVAADLDGFVATAALSEWRETLAVLCTHAPPERFTALADALGDRLALEAGDAAAATIAYICAQAVVKVVALWLAAAKARAPAVGKLAAMQDFAEKAAVFRRVATIAAGGGGAFCTEAGAAAPAGPARAPAHEGDPPHPPLYPPRPPPPYPPPPPPHRRPPPPLPRLVA